jgi:hypothetical protein
MKIVVFDLDETLGYFTQYGIFWDCLNNYFKTNLNSHLVQSDFNSILDLFPEFLRPNIMNILTYLKHKKQSKCCHKMMIYTNNQGPREWAHHIISYFESKIKYKLFDQIIAAFKVNGKNVEICRTTHDKTHKDFIKCTKIPANAEICFLDDSFFPGMSNDNIYYINIKPYFYDLEFSEMIQRFKNSNIGKKLIKNDDKFEHIIVDNIEKYNYDYIVKSEHEYAIDKIIGKQVLTHLYEFFNQSIKNKLNKTKKNRFNKKNRTQKNI